MNVKRIILAPLAMLSVFLALPSTAFADDATPVVTQGTQAVTGHTFVSLTISATLVTMLVSYIIPILTALITKATASANLKQFITALLAAANGLVVAGMVNDGTSVLSKEAILFAAGSFVLANISYISFWKPKDLNSKVVPGSGLGG